MSWRNQGITGSNNIPLGKARRFPGGEGGESEISAVSSPGAFSNGGDRERERERDVKRGRSPESTPPSAPLPFSSPLTFIAGADAADADGPRRRKKRNRWGDATENKAAGLMGLPTAIVANMTSEQLEAYTLHLRIEEITQKLKIDDVVPADGDRYAPPRPFPHPFTCRSSDTLATDHLRLPPSTTTTAVASTPERPATASASRRSATS